MDTHLRRSGWRCCRLVCDRIGSVSRHAHHVLLFFLIFSLVIALASLRRAAATVSILLGEMGPRKEILTRVGRVIIDHDSRFAETAVDLKGFYEALKVWVEITLVLEEDGPSSEVIDGLQRKLDRLPYLDRVKIHRRYPPMRHDHEERANQQQAQFSLVAGRGGDSELRNRLYWV